MGEGFAKVVSIIRKENKTPDQIAFLKMLLSKTKMFEQFKTSPEIVNGICAAVKLESYPKYQIVFKQGDSTCTKAYVILRGTVLVCMRNIIDIFTKDANLPTDPVSSTSNAASTDQSNPTCIDPSSHPQSDCIKNQLILDIRAAEQAKRRTQVTRLLFEGGEEIEGIQRNNISDTEFQAVLGKSCGKVIQEISEGSIFGEKALIEHKPRAATICTKSPSDFIILHKEDFEIIQHRFNKQQQEKKEFLMTMFPFLGTLVTSQRVFERVVRFFEEENFQKNAVIFHEGEIVAADQPEKQKVYLIASGEVYLYRNSVKHVSNPHVLHRLVTQTVHVASLDAKEIIGEELLLPNNNVQSSSGGYVPVDLKYEYTAVCISSSAQFFSVSVSALRSKLPDQITDYILHTFRFKQRGRLVTLNEFKSRNQSPGNRDSVDTQNLLHSIDNYSVEKALLRKIAYPHDQQRSNSSNTLNTSTSHSTSDKSNKIPALIRNNSSTNRMRIQPHSTFHTSEGGDKVEGRQSMQQSHQGIDIHGSSSTYDKFVLSEMRMNFEDKLAKESGATQNEVIDSRDYRELPKNFVSLAQSSKPKHTQQQAQTSKKNSSSRIQAYPFKIPPNPRYFQQLEENMKSKNFQYADTKRILQATRALHFHQEEAASESESNSSPKRKDLSHNNESAKFTKKLLHSLADQIVGGNSDSMKANHGKFHNVGEIKTHSILKRVAAQYTPHEEYFAKDFNTLIAEDAAAFNAKRLFRYYEQSTAAKDIVQSRMVLSKSPEARRENRLLADPHASIPSTKHTIMNNHTHVNQNYFNFKSNKSQSAERLFPAAASSTTATMMVLVASKQQSELKCFQEQPNRDRSIVQLRLHSPIRQYIYQQNRKITEQNEAALVKRRAQQLADHQEENSRFKPYKVEMIQREKTSTKTSSQLNSHMISEGIDISKIDETRSNQGEDLTSTAAAQINPKTAQEDPETNTAVVERITQEGETDSNQKTLSGNNEESRDQTTEPSQEGLPQLQNSQQENIDQKEKSPFITQQNQFNQKEDGSGIPNTINTADQQIIDPSINNNADIVLLSSDQASEDRSNFQDIMLKASSGTKKSGVEKQQEQNQQNDEESMIKHKPNIRINEKGDEEELIDLQSQENLVIPLAGGHSSSSTSSNRFASKFGGSQPVMVAGGYRSESSQSGGATESSHRRQVDNRGAFEDEEYFFDNIITIKVPFTDLKYEFTYCQTTKTICGSILLFVILYMYYIVFTLFNEKSS